MTLRLSRKHHSNDSSKIAATAPTSNNHIKTYLEITKVLNTRLRQTQFLNFSSSSMRMGRSLSVRNGRFCRRILEDDTRKPCLSN